METRTRKKRRFRRRALSSPLAPAPLSPTTRQATQRARTALFLLCVRDPDQNPFDRYDLDPREGIAAITERLKELAEDARDDAERERIRAAWEELTLHPARRLRAALFAHPETRPPLGAPPPFVRRRGPSAKPLGLRELAPRPSLSACLTAGAVAAEGRGGAPKVAAESDRPPPLDEDPLV
jgi:hypothetical protein